MKKILWLIAFVVIVAGIAGGYKYPQMVASFGTTAGTAGTQLIAEFPFNPTVAGATTTSVLNSDTQDRIVRTVDVSCSGVGTSRTAYTGAALAAWNIKVASTSTSAPSDFTNTNYVFNVNISTTTTDVYAASSSSNVVNSASGNGIRWPAGAYMTAVANATNTAACVVSVSYLQGLGF